MSVRAIQTAANASDLLTLQTALGTIHQITDAVADVVTSLSADIASVTDATRSARLNGLMTPLQTAETNIGNDVAGLQRHITVVAGAPTPPGPTRAQWDTVRAHARVLDAHFTQAVRAVEALSRALNSP